MKLTYEQKYEKLAMLFTNDIDHIHQFCAILLYDWDWSRFPKEAIEACNMSLKKVEMMSELQVNILLMHMIHGHQVLGTIQEFYESGYIFSDSWGRYSISVPIYMISALVFIPTSEILPKPSKSILHPMYSYYLGINLLLLQDYNRAIHYFMEAISIKSKRKFMEAVYTQLSLACFLSHYPKSIFLQYLPRYVGTVTDSIWNMDSIDSYTLSTKFHTFFSKDIAFEHAVRYVVDIGSVSSQVPISMLTSKNAPFEEYMKKAAEFIDFSIEGDIVRFGSLKFNDSNEKLLKHIEKALKNQQINGRFS